jgi:hypothetical protein
MRHFSYERPVVERNRSSPCHVNERRLLGLAAISLNGGLWAQAVVHHVGEFAPSPRIDRSCFLVLVVLHVEHECS